MDANIQIQKCNVKTGEVTVIEGSNYKVYGHATINVADYMAICRAMTIDKPSRESNTSNTNTAIKDMWQVYGQLPYRIDYSSFIFTSSDNGSQRLNLTASTASDSGYLGHINTHSPHSGSETDKGTINTSESVIYGRQKAKFVLDVPTHAINGSIKTIHFLNKPVSSNYPQYYIPNGGTIGGERIYYPLSNSNGEYTREPHNAIKYKDYWFYYSNYAEKSTILKPVGNHVRVGVNTITNAYGYITLNGKLYAYLRNYSYKHNNNKTGQLFKEVLITENNGEIKVSLGDDYNPLADVTLPYTYMQTVIPLTDKTFGIIMSSGSSSTTLYFSIYNVETGTLNNITQSFYGSYYPRIANIKINGDGTTSGWIMRDGSGSFEYQNYYYTFSENGVTVATNKSYTGTVKYTDELPNYRIGSLYVDGYNASYQYGVITRNPQVFSIQLAEPIVKTDAETLKLTIEVDLTVPYSDIMVSE